MDAEHVIRLIDVCLDGAQSKTARQNALKELGECFEYATDHVMEGVRAQVPPARLDQVRALLDG